ncbi:MAG: 4Fe-4S dicluster domain-containing protein [Verrucomicrobia bacterium]|nr:4Fe-4S dicluster domain-containing protein [Verrucomicrobiota bacterium]
MPTGISRRNLFRLRPGDYLTLFREVTSPNAPKEAPRQFRPPGALSNEDEFLSVCDRCAECSIACPYQVIEHLGPIAGPAEGTPVLNPELNPCHWCASMDCIRACPSGALSFAPDDLVPPIGKASIQLELCLNEQGILCDTCAMQCPPGIKAITMKNRRPILDAAACVGCGLCAYHCEASPKAFKLETL